jgi:hypothetical protein
MYYFSTCFLQPTKQHASIKRLFIRLFETCCLIQPTKQVVVLFGHLKQAVFDHSCKTSCFDHLIVRLFDTSLLPCTIQLTKQCASTECLTSYRNNNLVVDATAVAVNSSWIQKENKYHSEHGRKQIGYNNNREPQPLDNTSCQIVR